MRADQSEHVIWIPVAWKVHVFEEMYELKSWLLSKLEIFVVYHLHGQTGRLTVWENGEQNWGLVNWFGPGIAFTIDTNHGSIYYRKTAAKALNWYQRWLWRNGTRIAVWRSPNGKTTTILDFPSLPEMFHWNNQKGRVPFNFQPDFLETFCSWNPTSSKTFLGCHAYLSCLTLGWVMFEGNCCIRICCEEVQRESLRASCYLGLELELLTVHTGSADNFGRLLFFRNFGVCKHGSTQCLPSVRGSLKVSVK